MMCDDKEYKQIEEEIHRRGSIIKKSEIIEGLLSLGNLLKRTK